MYVRTYMHLHGAARTTSEQEGEEPGDHCDVFDCAVCYIYVLYGAGVD